MIFFSKVFLFPIDSAKQIMCELFFSNKKKNISFSLCFYIVWFFFCWIWSYHLPTLCSVMLGQPILWIHSVDMPAATMFSKFKSSGTTVPQNSFDNNPITQHFEIGKQVGSSGPEYVWKIYDCIRKSDGRVSITTFNSSI